MSQFQKFFAIAAVGLLTLAALWAESAEDRAVANNTGAIVDEQAIVGQAEVFWNTPQHKWDAWMQERAEEWLPRWEAAAEAGLAEAQFFVGRSYYVGIGVEQDFEQAFNWSQAGAEQGYAPCQNLLGALYSYGQGVEQEVPAGTAWIRKAAEQGLYLAQRNLGQAYLNGWGVRVDRDQALDWYQLAAAQGDPEAHQQMGILFFESGSIHYQASRYAAAREAFDSSLKAKREAYSDQPNHPSIATILFNLGMTYRELEDDRAALQYFKAALATYQKVYIDHPHHQSIVKTQNHLGIAYEEIGEFVEARACYEAALSKLLSVNNSQPNNKWLGLTLHNLGALDAKTGDFVSARDNFESALAKKRIVYANQANHPSIAVTLQHLGRVYGELANYTKALECQKAALAIKQELYREQRNHPSIARTLEDLGNLYLGLGKYEASREHFNVALAIYREVYAENSNHLAIALMLENLAVVDWLSGEFADSHERMIEVLELRRHGFATGNVDQLEIVQTLQRLGVMFGRLGDYEIASECIETALAIFKEVHADQLDVPQMAQLASNLATVYMKKGEYASAHVLLDVSFLIYRKAYANSFNHPSITNTLIKHAQLWKASGQNAPAILYGKLAVNTLQGIRELNRNLDDALQQSFLEAWEQTYRRLADWLVEAGRFSEAQVVLSMLKEQEYSQQLGSSAASDRQDARAAHLTIPLFMEEQEAYAPVKDFNERIQQQILENRALHEERRQNGGELPKAKATRFVQLQEELQVEHVTVELAQAREQMAQKLEELAATNPTRLRSGDQSYAKLLRQLRATGAEARLLSYIVGEDGITWFLIQPDAEPLQGRIAMDRGALNRKILTFHRQLADPHSNPRPLSRELYELLLAPVREALDRESVDTLLLSLDYNLRRIPFACLHDGEQYLVESFQLARFSEQGKFFLDQALREGAQRSALPETPALAVGVSEAHAPFEALPAVRDEIDAVVLESIEDPRGILRGLSLLDEAFTLDRFREALATRGQAYRNSEKTEEWVLHLATHFALDPLDRGRSYLLLGDGGRLSFSEIAKGALSDGLGAFPGVDLIVLSACDTAMERPRDDGRSIDSLAILAHKQQAQGVMATLWPVIDQTTPAVIELFYHERFRNGLNKAEALRQAQLACLQTRHQSPESILAARYDNSDRQRPGLLLTALAQASATSPEATRRGGEHWKPPAERNNSQTTEPTASPTEETKNTQYPGFSHPAYWAPFVLIGDFL